MNRRDGSATKSASAGYLARRCSAFLGPPRGHTDGDRAYGPLTDQVALYGILAQLRALGALNYSIYGVHAHLTKTKEKT